MDLDEPTQPNPTENTTKTNTIATKPGTALNDILNDKDDQATKLAKLSNAYINLHEEATAKIDVLERTVQELTIRFSSIQTGIESDAESNATKDLSGIQ